MCFYIVTYTDWACGYRQNTGRHRAECNRPTCRLSSSHRDDDHDCEKDCTGRLVAMVWVSLHDIHRSTSQMEDQHLIMEHPPRVCGACQELGRGEGEHPGGHGSSGGQNGTNGSIHYQHVGVLETDLRRIAATRMSLRQGFDFFT
ncbi:hypothetical protein C8Q79DRAFT_985910 [Trametes meyenii]|nr:hypothetical protein C8Q79DRAFT_985910 [Trametes meyenii]